MRQLIVDSPELLEPVVLYYTILYYSLLCYSLLYCFYTLLSIYAKESHTVPYNAKLYYAVLHYTILDYTILHFTTLTILVYIAFLLGPRVPIQTAKFKQLNLQTALLGFSSQPKKLEPYRALSGLTEAADLKTPNLTRSDLFTH